MIIIKTPQPDIEERLVLVPVRRIVPESRDATPDDLARAGWVPLAAFVGPLDLLTPPTLDGVLEAIHSVREAVATECDRQHDEAMARAEKAERELAEVREAAFDADSGPGEAPTAFEAVTGLRLRVERAERERNDVLRDPCARGRSWEAMRSDRDRLLTVALDAERELVEARAELARLTAPVEEPRIVPGSADHLEAWSAIAAFVESGGGTSSSVATQKAVVRIEGAFRSFVALGVAHERARVSALLLREAAAYETDGVITCSGMALRQAVADLGGDPSAPGHERARQQPEKDLREVSSELEAMRTTHDERERVYVGAIASDEELVTVYRRAAEPLGDEHGEPLRDLMRRCQARGIRAVAARVRQERCLVAQAVGTNVDIRVCEDDGGGFMVGVHAPGCDEELTRCVPPADVPATLARLLGEVAK